MAEDMGHAPGGIGNSSHPDDFLAERNVPGRSSQQHSRSVGNGICLPFLSEVGSRLGGHSGLCRLAG